MKIMRTTTFLAASVAVAVLGTLSLRSTTLAAPPCNIVRSSSCPDTGFITVVNSGNDGTALTGACTAEFSGIGVYGVTTSSDGIGVVAESIGAGIALEARGQAFFTDKIGVGSSAPIGHIEISANGTFNNQFLRMTEITSGQTWVWVVNTDGNCFLFDNNTNTSPFLVTPTGNIGLGTTTTPSERLEVAGNVCATGYLTCSDRRFKDDIQPIESALHKIKSLAGVTYTWSEEYDEWAGSEQGEATQIGLIAQDVERVCPEVVSTMEDGYRRVDYSKLTAVLVEAVKDQQEQIEDLKRQLEALDSGR